MTLEPRLFIESLRRCSGGPPLNHTSPSLIRTLASRRRGPRALAARERSRIRLWSSRGASPRTLNYLESLKVPVLVVGAPPAFPFDVPRCCGARQGCAGSIDHLKPWLAHKHGPVSSRRFEAGISCGSSNSLMFCARAALQRRHFREATRCGQVASGGPRRQTPRPSDPEALLGLAWGGCDGFWV